MSHIPDPLRKQLYERARGCCEYCLIDDQYSHLPHELDHIIPEKHRGETRENNLCLACFDCNRHKGSDFASLDPETKQIVRLFNPRADKWPEHFKLNGPTIQPFNR
jgi:5-methylcytosine-specific restriction endonuclease McrA